MLALALLLAVPAFAAEKNPRVSYVATLRNGFTISHLRSETRDGGITRLYTAADGYVDVPTADITSIATEELAPVPEQPTASDAQKNTVPPLISVPQLVTEAGGKHNLDEDFIKSVIRAESGFNPKARSAKGAQGLMQLMPGTAQKLGVQDPFEPGANIEGGTRYLRELLEQYHGDVAKALAAYNAGPQRVDQYRGVPPYHETRAYVRKVINDYNRTKRAEQKQKKTTTAKKEPAETAKK